MGGAGGPLAVLFVTILAAELGKAVSKETKIDILVTPIVTVLAGIGFADCRVDAQVGRRILGPLDLEHAPMFGIAARKP